MKTLSPTLLFFSLIAMTVFSKPFVGSQPRHHTKEFVLNALLGGLSGSNRTKEDVSGGITSTSKQFHASQSLFENSSRLGTCAVLMDGLDERLTEFIKKLPKKQAEALKKEQTLLRKTITPMLATTKVSTESAAQELSPIAGAKKENERKEVLSSRTSFWRWV